MGVSTWIKATWKTHLMISPKPTDSTQEFANPGLARNTMAAAPAVAVAAPPPQSSTLGVPTLSPTRYRSKTRVHQRTEGIRSKVQFPEPRKDGRQHYLRQWFITCTSLVAA